MLRAQASAIARLEVQYHGERMYSRGLERRLAALSRAANRQRVYSLRLRLRTLAIICSHPFETRSI
jgi:hypothetical protein